MGKISILNVAYPFAEVSSKTAGGAEQALMAIDRALVKQGYNSTVIARKHSDVAGKLIELDCKDENIELEVKEETYRELKAKLDIFLQNNNVDLIHFHGLDFINYMPKVKIPILVTLHLPLNWYNEESFSTPGIYFNCVSHYQFLRAKNNYPVNTFIENGVIIPDSISNKNNGSYAFSMGRICFEKGYHLAIDAAKIAQIPFLLAGRVYPYSEHLLYYQTKVLPHIISKNCRFVGEADVCLKRHLFNFAKCLLVPSLVEETSSLVAMEAMANGVPVVAFKAGALNDIVKNGENGYLVQDVIEMAKAINEVDKISPEICHSIAKKNYSVDRMTSQYLDLYKKLIINN